MLWNPKTVSLLLAGVACLVFGAAKWAVTARVVAVQQKAATGYLQETMTNRDIAPGLVNAPRVLHEVYQAARLPEARRSGIVFIAGGVALLVGGVLLQCVALGQTPPQRCDKEN